LAVFSIASAASYNRALMRHAAIAQLEHEKSSVIDDLKTPFFEKDPIANMKPAQLGSGLGLPLLAEKQPTMAYDGHPVYDDALSASLINLPVLAPQPTSASSEATTSSPTVDVLSVPLPPSPLLRPRRSSLKLGLRTLGAFSFSQLTSESFTSPSSSSRLLAPKIEVEAPPPIAIAFPPAPTEPPVS
jgi:hypothetical protein